jgi:hypothetical protein
MLFVCLKKLLPESHGAVKLIHFVFGHWDHQDA